MKGWNPFGKIDMEVGSFLKYSKFNKTYGNNEEAKNKAEDEAKKPKNINKPDHDS